MAKNPEDIKNEREQGGIEYASWVDSAKDALRLADLAGLLPGGRLAKGYEITERPWYYEDDLREDE